MSTELKNALADPTSSPITNLELAARALYDSDVGLGSGLAVAVLMCAGSLADYAETGRQSASDELQVQLRQASAEGTALVEAQVNEPETLDLLILVGLALQEAFSTFVFYKDALNGPWPPAGELN